MLRMAAVTIASELLTIYNSLVTLVENEQTKQT
jgi:hypothetical protein